MIRNLKALGISLVAMFAMGALSASAASAVDVVTTGASPALLTGVGHNHVLSADPRGSGIEFQCTTSKFAATVKSGESEITADVAYEGTLNATPHTEVHCNSSAGTLTIDMNECDYKLTGETTGTLPAKTGEAKDATVWIECPEGKKIQITSSLGVTLSVPPQTPTKGGVVYRNIANHPKAGEPSAVEVEATVTGITVTCAGTFLCTLGGIPHHSNEYQYTGNVIMTAYKDNNEAGKITPANEGERVSLVSS